MRNSRQSLWFLKLGLGATLGATLAIAAVIVVGLASQAKPGQAKPAQPKPAPPAVRVWQDTLTLPTYELGPPDPNPPFDFFAAGRFNYPYTMLTNLTGRSAPRAWRALNLENEYLMFVLMR